MFENNILHINKSLKKFRWDYANEGPVCIREEENRGGHSLLLLLFGLVYLILYPFPLFRQAKCASDGVSICHLNLP